MAGLRDPIFDAQVRWHLRLTFWQHFAVYAAPGLIMTAVMLTFKFVFGAMHPEAANAREIYEAVMPGWGGFYYFLHRLTWVVIGLDFLFAFRQGQKAQGEVLEYSLRIIQLAQEMQEEEKRLRKTPLIIIYLDESRGKWVSRKFINGQAKVGTFKELRYGSDTTVEQVFFETKSRKPGCEVMVAACAMCATPTTKPGGEFDGEPVIGGYEFKRNGLGFSFAPGAYICLSCKPRQDDATQAATAAVAAGIEREEAGAAK